VNFKHCGDLFFARCAREITLYSSTLKMMPHTSTSPDPVSNSTCLEMNMGGKKAVVKGERLVLVKTNIRGGPYRIIRGGGSLRLAPAL